MDWTLAELAAAVDGQLFGQSDLVCHGANPPSLAERNEITLLDDPKQVDLIESSAACAIVVGQRIESVLRAQIVVADPHRAFATIVSKFRPPIDDQSGFEPPTIDDSASIHPSAHIGSGSTIGRHVKIGPGVVVMPKCEIGDHSCLHANVTLYEYTQLAERVTIHSGSTIGANGFGYREQHGIHCPTAQLGYVAIKSDVEVGAGVTIDRGTYGPTTIGEGTKIDNQVQIGHNCQIGKHNLLCSQVGIAGSCTTGDHVILAGQVGLADHVHLGDRAIVGAQAGVMDDLAGDQVYLGSPTMTQRDTMQVWAIQRKLPAMRRELKQLRRDVARLSPDEQTIANTDSDNQRAA